MLPDDPFVFLKFLFLFVLGLMVTFQRGISVEISNPQLPDVSFKTFWERDPTSR
jgi:hypothetical protein